ncbi:NAD-dependent epimerase/dehydratase family protein [Azospirillum sp. sgz301742]
MSNPMAVLVTGGTSYIGSHAVLALCDAGIPVLVLDDLSTGRRAAMPEGVPLVVGNVGDGALVANCGYGNGYSVREVLRAVERVTGRPLAQRMAPCRAGDPPALIAAPGLLRRTLGWTPRLNDLDGIVRSALDWERACLVES